MTRPEDARVYMEKISFTDFNGNVAMPKIEQERKCLL
jgi:hypothetical protein